MREAIDATGMTWDEAFYLATLGGAHVLGAASCIGSLDPGKDADFVVADYPGISEITAVYVRGRLVYF
jgi:imidazolonepropionase-like amidohydrolase